MKAAFCLGINFELNEIGISLSQKQYLLRLLGKYWLSEAYTVSTQMDYNVKLVHKRWQLQQESGSSSIPINGTQFITHSKSHSPRHSIYCWNSFKVKCRTNSSPFNCSQESLSILEVNTWYSTTVQTIQIKQLI